MKSAWGRRWSSCPWRLGAIAALVMALCLPGSPKPTGHAAQLQTTTSLPLTFKLASPQDILTLQPLFRRFLALDGADDYAAAPDSSALDLGRGSSPDFTIETFLYIDPSAQSGTRALLEREQFTIHLLLTSGTADGIRLHLHFEGGEWSLFPAMDLTAGWHHLAVVFDNEFTPGLDRATIYLDGSLQAFRSGPDQGPVLNSSRPLFVGSPDGAPFGGRVEELRLSSAARYTTGSFDPPKAYFEPDAFTRALWHFDEYPGSTTFADSSGRDNTLVGRKGAQTGDAE